jgi:hypothetical protein
MTQFGIPHVSHDIPLSAEERARFERWIINHVDASVVPADEGNSEALVYNLIHLLRGDGLRFEWKPDQIAELRDLGLLDLPF